MFNKLFRTSCYLLLIVGSLSACQPGEKEHANALIHETSPYLLQHAHNPVNWYPWGEAALEKAAKDNKLLIISVGYAACHWCHVMEEESFEDSTVAAVMNTHYVAIKVDREERPDLDQIYMEAAQLANGRGGWPLNAIALPDGRPVFAGSYYPRENWLRIIRQMAELYEKSPERLELVAEQLTRGIRAENVVNTDRETAIEQSDVAEYFHAWAEELDLEHGGTRGAPKFPVTAKQHLLMQYAYHTGNDTAYQALTTTLDAMMQGGLYDHLGGGFARYATDEQWRVPHFEKMLYDNAMLISLYSDAFRYTADSRYEQVVRQSLAFLQREMYDPVGAFYASLDADTEGAEGKYYVWTAREVDAILGEAADEFKQVYHITDDGNWEKGKNILYTSGQSFNARPAKALENSRQKLFMARQRRERPATDDKIITAWNALAVSAFADAYRALGDEALLAQALETAHFLHRQMTADNGELYRSFRRGQVKITAFLDDYALLTRAYISLYQLTFDLAWLERASKLTDYVLTHFSDADDPLFFYTSQTQAELIAREKEVLDNVIPSSNAIMAENLYILGQLYYDSDYLQRAEKMVLRMKADVLAYPDAYAYWALLMLRYAHEPYEVAIVGKNYESIRKKFDDYYIPNTIFLGGEEDKNLPLLANKKEKGKTVIYVCQDKVCKLPVEEVEQALTQIATFSGL